MERFVYVFYFFFQGILFFQAFFLLVFYAYTKTKESLYFGLFLLITSVNFFMAAPKLFYAANDAALGSWWFKLVNIPLVIIGNIFFTLFLRDFFGTLINNKTLTLVIRYVLIIQYILFLPFIMLYSLGKPTDFIFNIVNFVGLSSCVWMTIIIVRKRMRYANLVAVGFACYILGSFLTSYMLIKLAEGVQHHFFIDTYPLFFIKCGIFGITACYLVAIIKKWHFQEKELSVQKLEAVLMEERMINQLANERSRIAADMHDDVGAGLSRIRYIATALREGSHLTNEDIDRILSLSDESVEKMNEIIWSLNQGNRSMEELIAHIRSQCAVMVTNANLVFKCEFPNNIPAVNTGWNEGRNIYMLTKEAVNNAVKHAQASTISLDFLFGNQQLTITITDNGKGFNVSGAGKEGNGLKNYGKRILVLNGAYQINTIDSGGTQVVFTIPLNGS